MSETMILRTVFVVLGLVLASLGVFVIPRTIDTSKDRILTWRGWVEPAPRPKLTVSSTSHTSSFGVVSEGGHAGTYEYGADGSSRYVLNGRTVEYEAFAAAFPTWADRIILSREAANTLEPKP